MFTPFLVLVSLSHLQVNFDLNTYSTAQDVAFQLSQTVFNGGLSNLSGGLATTVSECCGFALSNNLCHFAYYSSSVFAHRNFGNDPLVRGPLELMV